ncbi:TPA: hypothetical protein MHU15_24505 [Klebsiella pneumoniae]|nr:hypothetical protein [Klebsiella pneumoniae]
MTRSTVSCVQPRICHPDDFSCCHHLQADNKQPYSHAVKLQDGRSGRIRLFALYEVSGSVPRSGNRQSGVFRW